jgi:UTP--glucose-1-phosphate uridylyltransferase
MLPLINKPLIQFAVEEALDSGIEQIIVITAAGKRAIEDYFDRSCELEHFLERKGNIRLLSEVRELAELCDICYIRQKEQLGLGHAVLMAKDVVGNEPFALLLPDDIIDSAVPVLKQLADVYDRQNGSVIAVERIRREDSSKYGVIAPRLISNNVYEVRDMVEKPEPEDAPSDLGIVGRYVLTPEIFDVLKETRPGKGGEIQLTDALAALGREQPVYACAFNGTRYDTGTPAGWLKAVVAYALKHPDYGPEFREYLAQVMERVTPL